MPNRPAVAGGPDPGARQLPAALADLDDGGQGADAARRNHAGAGGQRRRVVSRLVSSRSPGRGDDRIDLDSSGHQLRQRSL